MRLHDFIKKMMSFFYLQQIFYETGCTESQLQINMEFRIVQYKYFISSTLAIYIYLNGSR